MGSLIQTPEMRDTYEETHLTELSLRVGESLVRQLLGEHRQLPLFEDTGIRSVILKRYATENPDRLIVLDREMDDYRYTAGVLASTLSDQQIAAGTNGNKMWDQVLDNLRSNITDKNGNSYDIAAQAHAISSTDLVYLLASDYREIAEDRLNGFDLIYKADDGEPISAEEWDVILKQRVEKRMDDYWEADDDEIEELEEGVE
jgi:hypothetical protein